MKRFFYGVSACQEMDIRYYLLAETLENETEIYGVLVEYREESAEIPAITESRSRAESLLETLRQGNVTPVAARDVVEDWLLA